MSKHAKGGNFIIPRGGVEHDELRYVKTKSDKIQNFEKIPGVTYSFMEGGMRETWEEVGVKGKVTKNLGHYYYYDSYDKSENYEAWVRRVKKKFPKSGDYYYQMEVDEVCEEWPEKGKRIQKWLGVDNAISHIVSNGRLSAFKALLKTDLVEDRDAFYRKYFNADLVDNKYKVFFRNRPYEKYSEEISKASPMVVDVILNKSSDKIMLGLTKLAMTKIEMRHEPFVWRSSLFFKMAEAERKKIELVSVKYSVGYIKKIEVDSLDLETYRFAVTCCVCEVDDDFEADGYTWVEIKEWKKELDGVSKIMIKCLEDGSDELVDELEKLKL